MDEIGTDAWCRREIVRLGAMAAEVLAGHGIASDEDTVTIPDQGAALWALAEALLEVKDTADTLLAGDEAAS